MIKAIFFDMDGVLIDSMQVHVKSWFKALDEYDLKPTEQELEELGGLPFYNTIKHFAKHVRKDISEETVKEIYKLKWHIFKDSEHLIKPFPIKENLHELKQSGIKLFVVTSSPRKAAQKSLNNYFPNIFEDVICVDDVENGKPHPDPYLRALKLSGFQKDECCIVEDAPLGVKAGISAGITTYAIETTLNKKYLQKATKVFKDHNDLFNYIEKLI